MSLDQACEHGYPLTVTRLGEPSCPFCRSSARTRVSDPVVVDFAALAANDRTLVDD
jgi:hypothetical protein